MDGWQKTPIKIHRGGCYGVGRVEGFCGIAFSGLGSRVAGAEEHPVNSTMIAD